MKTFQQLAQAGYKAYCKRAGGVTFDGKPIPAWEHIGAERQECWVACAAEVLAQGAASLHNNMMAELQSDVAAIDLRSVKTIKPNNYTTLYQFDDVPLPVAELTLAPSSTWRAGGDGDFGGAGASGSFGDSGGSSDSNTSTSDSSSSGE